MLEDRVRCEGTAKKEAISALRLGDESVSELRVAKGLGKSISYGIVKIGNSLRYWASKIFIYNGLQIR
jgi:hypothetical protein